MYLRNAWYVAGMDHEVRRGEFLRRVLLGQPVLLYRDSRGRPVALDDRCSHRHAPLSQGRLKGDNVVCPYHGLEFDRHGTCVRIPSQKAIPPGANIRTYPVAERHHWIWLWMGDPQFADEASIEDFHWADDSTFRSAREYLHFAGHYQLVIDNLLDLSHLSFVHQNTLGTDRVAQAPIKVERHGNLIRSVRQLPDTPPSPLLTTVLGSSANLDRWLITDYTPPAHVRIRAASAPAGTIACDGLDAKALNYYVLVSITPETESSCHYFRQIAHDFLIGDPTITDLYLYGGRVAMEEDQRIIAAQQRNMDASAGPPWIDLNADAGGLQARAVLNRLIGAEQDRCERSSIGPA